MGMGREWKVSRNGEEEGKVNVEFLFTCLVFENSRE